MTKFTSIFIVIILFTLMPLYAQSIKKENYKLTIEKGKILTVNNEKYWIVPVTLSNNTNTRLNYLSMSCSWQEFYSVDNKKLNVVISSCDKNTPIVVTLGPKQSKKVDLKLSFTQSANNIPTPLRIGLNLIPLKGKTEKLDLKNLRNEKNIIWSNQIILK